MFALSMSDRSLGGRLRIDAKSIKGGCVSGYGYLVKVQGSGIVEDSLNCRPP